MILWISRNCKNCKLIGYARTWFSFIIHLFSNIWKQRENKHLITLICNKYIFEEDIQMKMYTIYSESLYIKFNVFCQLTCIVKYNFGWINDIELGDKFHAYSWTSFMSFHRLLVIPHQSIFSGKSEKNNIYDDNK